MPLIRLKTHYRTLTLPQSTLIRHFSTGPRWTASDLEAILSYKTSTSYNIINKLDSEGYIIAPVVPVAKNHPSR